MSNSRKMDLLFILTLVSLVAAIRGEPKNSSVLIGNIDHNDITYDGDSEKELQSELQHVDIRRNEWEDWSDWSPCSRSCDGGVSHQLRRCVGIKCRGEIVRYKICNMQPCPDYSDFRENQCASFNNIPYDNQLLRWVAYYDDHNPCTLMCKGKPTDSSETKSEEDTVMVVAKLADKVHDGTRCRPGSLDMCIDGKCQRVGCDLRIGSTLQIDNCGVCGGDGTSCSQPLYHWTLKFVSLCSVTCGGGYKMTSPVCQNRVTGAQVEEDLCNASQKPDASVVRCNIHSCPPKWHAADWEECSASCGGGIRTRQIYCVEETNNTKIKVDEEKCSSARKPKFQEPCNQVDCPKWHTSPWSGCSVSCGEGVQVRIVDCRDAHDYPSAFCDPDLKPTSSKLCSTGIQCPTFHNSVEEILPNLYHTQPLVHPYPPPAPAQAERLIGTQIVPSETTFIPEEWGPCSVTCGEGIRKREVHCKIFLEFSKTIAKLPDQQCTGPKPIEVEKCFMESCSSERIDIKDDPYRSENMPPGATYSWKTEGFTQCTASCLGGVQELIVKCVRDDTQKEIAFYMCPKETKPQVVVQACNDFACPPRWNFSDFSSCSQSCGIGIQTREVHCIHEVSQVGGSIINVPSDRCPQPAPPDRQFCNVLDCPIRWKTSEWSKCSKSCGGGEKTRSVECKQVMAQNHTVERPLSACPGQKPPDKKPCNTKSCVTDTDKPIIDTLNTTYIQHDWKKDKVSLRVGGAATVFSGTTIKIKCPVKRFNRSLIAWTKDNSRLQNIKKYKVSKKGALRVLNISHKDHGIYTCTAGKSSASLTLMVKPRPGEFPSSEEIQKHSQKYMEKQGRQIGLSRYPTMVPDWNEDLSHEGQTELVRKTSTSKSKAPTYLSVSEKPISSNSLNGLPPDDINTNFDYRDVSLNTPALSNSEAGVLEGTSSSGNRVMPHFQQLLLNLQYLWPFQMFGSSRGHRMVTISENENAEDFTEIPELDETAFTSQMGASSGIVPTEMTTFRWFATKWSSCSETCGKDGFQIRTFQCAIVSGNITKFVNNTLCEESGVKIPKIMKKCETEPCSFWNASHWTPCNVSKCFKLNTAIQRREVICQLESGEVVNPRKCDSNNKPPYRQECHNVNCKGKWIGSPWSACSAACDSNGFKYRIIHCVWIGTKRIAGNVCNNQKRPSVIKKCKGSPCYTKDSLCRDISQFCPNVRKMNLCRLKHYKHQCCQTCRHIQ
ncbi:protein madd-4 isoform X3 [Agrilus planipennis]|uniref:Protein madd-4 isoform X3 n=1 Tax=Agrilus planipennis TaxID=224129 RepID=A0A7F5RAB4_AGRPL|nr:protein madd-4 isoform X3 [Agrilus planipennis]